MKKLSALLLSLLLALFALSSAGESRFDAVFDPSQDPGRLTVRFIAMDTPDGSKAGDCAVITSPEGLVMVIDAGSPAAAPSVLRALDAMGLERIDLLVASHPHIDHVGGMPALVDRYAVGEAFVSHVDYDSPYTRALLDALSRKGIPLTRLARGDQLKLGEEVVIDILWPGAEIKYYDNYPEGATQFINNLSLVLRVSYRGTVLLFPGDLYSLGEQAVLETGDNLKADVLKVNHHGDKTSSSKAWRLAVAPQAAVITHNALADLRVPRKFEEEGALVLHTFIKGSIRIASEGGGVLDILTERD